MAGPKRIRNRGELMALAAELGVRQDWHEPDNQGVTAGWRAEGMIIELGQAKTAELRSWLAALSVGVAAAPVDPQTRAEMEALPLLLQKAQAHATMAQVIATIQAAWWRAANTGPSPEWLQVFREET